MFSFLDPQIMALDDISKLPTWANDHPITVYSETMLSFAGFRRFSSVSEVDGEPVHGFLGIDSPTIRDIFD